MTRSLSFAVLGVYLLWCRLILMALAGLVLITMVDFDVGYAFSDSQGGSLPSNDKDADAKEKEKDVPQQTRSV